MKPRTTLRLFLTVLVLALASASEGMAQRQAEDEQCSPWMATPVAAGAPSTTDMEWKYVSVRRLLVFLESSLGNDLDWAVFEPDPEPAWARVQKTIEGFFQERWREAALEGRTAGEAFHVRCDRSTMTQREIDAGRLICLVGVAPAKPGEFVYVRVERQVRCS